jgi:hypothetical protein
VPETNPPPSSAGSSPALPDPILTPGRTNASVTQVNIGQTICASGWTASVRPPQSYTERIKRLEAGNGGTVTYNGATYEVHGFRLADPDIRHFELDHLIPLGLGGSPADPHNLWMEPYEAPTGSAPVGGGSQTKDRVENVAREAVCSGRMSLVDAQARMAANWWNLGQALGVVGVGVHR